MKHSDDSMGNPGCCLLSSYPRDDVVLVRSVEELACVLDAHRPVGGCKLNLDTTDTMAEISLHYMTNAKQLTPTALVTRLRTTWSMR